MTEAVNAEAAAAAAADAAAKASTDAAAAAAAKGATDGAAAAAKAPEKYGDFKLPEGVKLSAEELTELQSAAKELNLPQEAAQKLVDRTIKDRKTVEESVVAKQQAHVKELATAWKTTAEADKEFGGAALQANLATAVKARDAFATKELVTMLNDSGLGNHPEVVRFFFRVGKAMSEDKHVQAGGAAQDNSDAARAARMYPSMVQK